MLNNKILKITDNLFNNPITDRKYISNTGAGKKITCLNKDYINIIEKALVVDIYKTPEEFDQQFIPVLDIKTLTNIAKELNEYVVLKSYSHEKCLISPNGKVMLVYSEGKLYSRDFAIEFVINNDLDLIEGFEEKLNKAINNFVYIFAY